MSNREPAARFRTGGNHIDTHKKENNPPIVASVTNRSMLWRRLKPLLPLIVALLAYELTAWQQLNLMKFEGDEPHYMLITHSLCYDHDTDLANNHEAQDYLIFRPHSTLVPHAFDYRSNGTLRSIHSIGLPILLTLPYCLLGHPHWARLLMAALAALASWFVFLAVRDWTKRTGLAYATWAAFTFTAPMWTMAPQLYPDVVAVLGVAVAFRLFMSRSLTTGRVLGLGIIVAALPWLHNRFVVLSLLIALTTLVRLLRAGAGWKEILTLMALPAISAPLWMWNSYVWYGSILPSANYVWVSANVQEFSLGRWYTALADLALGREFGLVTYSPIYWVAVVGLMAMILHRKTSVIAPLVWLVGYALAVSLSEAAYQVGWGWNFPARVLLPVTPLLAVPLAYALRSSRWLRIVAFALFVVSVIITVQSLNHPYQALADMNGVSEIPLVRRIQEVYPSLLFVQRGAELDLSKMHRHTGQVTRDQASNTPMILAQPGIDEPGAMAFGPYASFQTGEYTVFFTLLGEHTDPSTKVAHLDVVTEQGQRILAEQDIYARDFLPDHGPRTFSFPIVTRDTWDLQFRVFFTGQSRLLVQAIAIKPQRDLPTLEFPDWPIVAVWGMSVVIGGLFVAKGSRTRTTSPGES